ncbi:MAG: TRAP transporter small permease subunit [Proteobacteria bacterium]|nr:TRAP transporter small permease subunit [Pseudomonadota bacterium]
MRFIGQAIDRFTDATGRLVGWLSLFMVLLTVLVVALRYLFDQGTTALQESIVYLHGAMFMLGIPYGLKEDAHVRVDIFYSNLSDRHKDLVNLVGHLVFLLPVSGFIFYTSLPYVERSLSILEGSSEVGGLPGVYLFKTLIPIMAAMLFIQGIAEIIRLLTRLPTKRTP